MARIRSIKPEFWTDRKLARCASRDARLLYIALWNIADEHGRLNGDPVWIKGQVFPYEDDIDANAVSKMLAELETPALGAVVPYEADGDPYLFLPKLARHQRLEPGKVQSRLPAPPDRADMPDPDGPGAGRSESRADSSNSRADKYARDSDHVPAGNGDADSPGSGADKYARDAKKSPLLYVAGSRLQEAGSRGVPREPVRDVTRQQPDANGLHEIPDNFAITDAMRRWAHRTYPGLNLDFETAQFCRYWRGEGRRKKSWVDAWEKWIADSHKRAADQSQQNGTPIVSRKQQERAAVLNRAMERARAQDALEAGQ